jgi:hypothetical protein
MENGEMINESRDPDRPPVEDRDHPFVSKKNPLPFPASSVIPILCLTRSQGQAGVFWGLPMIHVSPILICTLLWVSVEAERGLIDSWVHNQNQGRDNVM